MKKTLSFILVIAMFASCFSYMGLAICAIAEETELNMSKINYYYYDSLDVVCCSNDPEDFEENVGEDDTVEIVLQLNHGVQQCDCKQKIFEAENNFQADQIFQEHKNHIKETMSDKNAQFLSEHDISVNSSEYEVIPSEYSPFIQIHFDNYNEYAEYDEDIISLAAENETVSINIMVPIEVEPTATRVNEENAPIYPLADAIEDIGADDQTYDGDGIKVGIIEGEGVTFSSSHHDLNDLTIHTKSLNGVCSLNGHATDVTRIFCGSNGVARNVDEVYIYHARNITHIIPAIDWMVNNDCRVINASLGPYSRSSNGLYNWVTAAIDYYVYTFYVVYVCSAGNNGLEETEHLISFNAAGYNTITVAATDANNNIASFSSYGIEDSTYGRKPTISAPGTNITIYNAPLHKDDGTSLAAPMVAGVAVKLIEEFPEYEYYPEVIIAALVASATRVNGSSVTWDTHAGAGRVNYPKAREAMENAIHFYNVDDLIQTRVSETINLTPGKTIKAAAFWHAKSQTQGETDTVVPHTYTDYDLRLNTTSDLRIATSITAANIERIVFDNNSYVTLVLKLTQASERNPSADLDWDWGAVTWVYE